MAAPSGSSYDVVIVGGGVIGLACGWRGRGGRPRGARARPRRSRRRGVRRRGRDARSGDGSGLRRAAVARAEPARAPRAWPAFALELERASGLPSGYEASGALVVAADRDDVEELRRLHDFQRSLGLDAEWLGPRELRRREPRLSPRVAGGIWAPHDHQVDPRALLRALRATCLVRTGVEVTDLVRDGGRVRGVMTRSGETIGARNVVLAAGCWSGALAELPVRPVKGQIVRLHGSGERLAGRVVRTPRCYVVHRASGEVVVGATQEERGFDTARHGGRRPPPARVGGRGAAGRRGARARGDRGAPAAGDAGQPAFDRRVGRRRGCSTPPATTATASCSPR